MFAVLGHVQLKLDNNNRCYQKKKSFLYTNYKQMLLLILLLPH